MYNLARCMKIGFLMMCILFCVTLLWADWSFIELCKKGSVEEVEKAIKSGADCNELNVREAKTPLMWALYYNEDIKVAELLIKYGADANVKVKYGGDDKGRRPECIRTPLIFALKARKLTLDKVKLLVEHGADINADDGCVGNTPLSLAAAGGNIRTVQYLLDKGAKLEIQPLVAAAAAGHLDCVKFLIEEGVPINGEYKGYTALQVANTWKHKEVVDYLKSKGATTNDEKAFWALEQAIRNNNFPEVKKLVEKERVNINKPVDGLPLLAQALLFSTSAKKKGNLLEIFSYLIHSGIDVNSKFKKSGTALYYLNYVVGVSDVLGKAYSSEPAVSKKDKKRFQGIIIRAFQALLKAGADVNAKNDSEEGNGRTPLHATAAVSNYPIAMLLKAGAKVDEKDNRGQTPLHVACMAGNFLAIKSLVNAGADINIKDKEGKTPIEIICQGSDNVWVGSYNVWVRLKSKEEMEKLRIQIQDYFKNLNKM